MTATPGLPLGRRSHRAGRRRPATRLTVAGTAAHVFYELAAGVGMPMSSLLGPVPAAGLWATGTAGVMRAARTRPSSADPLFAALNGIALAAVVGHLASWPRRRAWPPWLRTCEGLDGGLMPAYNAVLYVSGAAAVVALLRENRSAPRWVGLLPLTGAPALAAAQHAEHRALRRQAGQHAAWWNRRLARGEHG